MVYDDSDITDVLLLRCLERSVRLIQVNSKTGEETSPLSLAYDKLAPTKLGA